ncbi:hypothetical protein HanHA300_Chr10g0346361 [Helianthus annuus]|nr:hypothetical protein HanHA300_Chr10g0346361 [Helianthus annuus]KAJ0519947.1 hypothetical protein HanIR_Chr10g0453981 [Helianthus annuus]KAJ0695489.1 hypothetical protein HanLR1_Chr10g0346201 [Helianthus annuus]
MQYRNTKGKVKHLVLNCTSRCKSVTTLPLPCLQLLPVMSIFSPHSTSSPNRFPKAYIATFNKEFQRSSSLFFSIQQGIPKIFLIIFLFSKCQSSTDSIPPLLRGKVKQVNDQVSVVCKGSDDGGSRRSNNRLGFSG